jgi:hypothetical protein
VYTDVAVSTNWNEIFQLIICPVSVNMVDINILFFTADVTGAPFLF